MYWELADFDEHFKGWVEEKEVQVGVGRQEVDLWCNMPKGRRAWNENINAQVARLLGSFEWASLEQVMYAPQMWVKSLAKNNPESNPDLNKLSVDYPDTIL